MSQHRSPLRHPSPSHFQSIHSHHHSYSLIFPSHSPHTKQSFATECDINTIMSRYLSTGELPLINERAPQYLDTSSGFDFAEMQAQIIQAQSLFNELPSTLRNRFQNDPGAFLAYCQDESNRPEMEKLGLLRKSPPPTTLPPADTRSVKPDESEISA